MGEELAPIVGSDGERVYRIGERGSGFRAKGAVQDFKSLRERCLAEGRLFEDSAFPADYSSLCYSRPPSQHVEWKRPGEIVDDPKLFVEDADRFDVQQGAIGNCWLLAAVANLTLQPKLFYRVIPEDQSFEDGEYAGIFHVRFWQYGKWIDVVVDDRLPTSDGSLIYLHSEKKNEFWSPLLEKAYAKLHGSYEALEGGFIREAMEDFTGGITESFETAKLPSNMYTILLHAYERDSLMGCSTPHLANVVEGKTAYGLVTGHAYSITRVRYVDIEYPGYEGKVPLLRVRNPWGNEAEWIGPWSDKSTEWDNISVEQRELIGLTFDHDGEFWISYNDFIAHFDRIDICHVRPENVESDATDESNKKWISNRFEGEWARGVSAGGGSYHSATHWQNPQYIIELVDPDEDDAENECAAIVALLQKARRLPRNSGAETVPIGFDIYRVDPNLDDRKPLPASFFRENASIVKTQQYDYAREVCDRVKLPPGKYCIVPSTYQPNQEAAFLLRVFTESSVTMAENDEEVGMGDVDERIEDLPGPPISPDDPMWKAFVNLAGEDGEIDWMELKNVLDYALLIELDPEGEATRELCESCAPVCQEFGIKLNSKFQGFSKDGCRSMVSMLDADGSGKLGFEEFKSLWCDIYRWKEVFKLYDPEATGKIVTSSLREALRSCGYSLNNRLLNTLVHRYSSKDDRVTVDDFLVCAVRLKTMIAKLKEGKSEDWSNGALFV